MSLNNTRSLCSRCERFDIQSFGRSAHPYQCLPLADTVKSAKRGCSFCSLVTESFAAECNVNQSLLGRMFRPFYIQLEVQRDRYAADIEGGGMAIHQITAVLVQSSTTSSLLRPISNCNHIRINVSADRGTPAHESKNIVGQLVTSDIRSLGNIVQAVQTWRRKCFLNHEHCNTTLSNLESIDADDAPLPSRCIEFQQVPGSNHLLFWLRNTRGMKGRYVILSHRWVEELTKVSSTTSKNYQQRVNGPPGSTSGMTDSGPGWSHDQKLTDLFIDTGRLAVGLGIQYVWIDSICIIQKDDEDFAEEATKMAGYYQHAWITVAATNTVREGAGFLREWTEPTSPPRVSRLIYRNRDGEKEGFLYLQCVTDSTLRQLYKQDISDSDLLTRGWVFQEWLLSPRIICFSDLMPLLVCAGSAPLPIAGNTMTNRNIDWHHVQEDNVPSHEDMLFRGTHSLWEKSYKSRLGLNLTASRSAVLDVWRQMIRIFSTLQLGEFVTDRLVSLAGVAREVGMALEKQPVLGSEVNRANRESDFSNTYASGLWLEDIVRELQWERVGEPGKTVARAHGFPSWSWLSFASEATDKTGQRILEGIGVQWAQFEVYAPPQTRKPRRLPDPVCAVSLKAAYIIPVGKNSDDWSFDLSQSTQWKMLDLSNGENDYGNSNRYIGLCFEQAKYIHVQLGPHFNSEKHSSIVARCTGHVLEHGEREHWRVVTFPRTDEEPLSTRDIIHGWASLEHPDHQQPKEDTRDDRVLALRIARLSEVNSLKGWFAPYTDTAAIVLYIRQVRPGETGDRAYFERLGIGRLFGSEIESEFAAAEEREIWLI